MFGVGCIVAVLVLLLVWVCCMVVIWFFVWVCDCGLDWFWVGCFCLLCCASVLGFATIFLLGVVGIIWTLWFYAGGFWVVGSLRFVGCG